MKNSQTQVLLPSSPSERSLSLQGGSEHDEGDFLDLLLNGSLLRKEEEGGVQKEGGVKKEEGVGRKEEGERKKEKAVGKKEEGGGQKEEGSKEEEGERREEEGRKEERRKEEEEVDEGREKEDRGGQEEEGRGRQEGGMEGEKCKASDFNVNMSRKSLHLDGKRKGGKKKNLISEGDLPTILEPTFYYYKR